MNTTYVFDPTKPDVRCVKCKYHRYVVVSFLPVEKISALHTFLHRAANGSWPSLNFMEAIHWWGKGIVTLQPKCLESYKKIGEK